MPQVVHTNPTISSDFGDKKGFEVKAVVKSLMNRSEERRVGKECM